MQQVNDKIIIKSRTVDAPPDTVWWKWTTTEGLRTFFGKENTMDLRVGGPFEIYFSMAPPAGIRGSEGCKVISYLPGKMLSFSWNAPPEYPGVRNHEHKTWVVVQFEPVAGNKTRVTISHLGWLDGAEWDQVYDYFDKAWITVLNWLEENPGK